MCSFIRSILRRLVKASDANEIQPNLNSDPESSTDCMKMSVSERESTHDPERLSSLIRKKELIDQIRKEYKEFQRNKGK